MCTVCISTFEYTFANLTAESSSWPWGHIFQPNERGRTEVACEYAVSVCVHLGYCSYVRTYSRTWVVSTLKCLDLRRTARQAKFNKDSHMYVCEYTYVCMYVYTYIHTVK